MDAEILKSDELCMTGKELRRLRSEADISQNELAKRMGWYRLKVERLEASAKFCLQSSEMAELLAALNSKNAN